MSDPKLREYECPDCGGKVEFDPESGQLACPYCGARFSPEEFAARLEARAREREGERRGGAAPAGASVGDPSGTPLPGTPTPGTATPGTPSASATGTPEVSKAELENWQQAEAEAEDLVTYTCESCGGEIVADRTLASMHCPYCDNPYVVMSQFQAQYRPNFIIPFQKTRAEAIEAFRHHSKSKELVPDIFSADAHLEEIQGVYVPYWLLSAWAHADYLFKAENTYETRDSRNIYREVKIYDVMRKGSEYFQKIPVEASTKFETAILESVEPYDFSGLIDFNPGYLSGFLANKYDLPAEESWQRGSERIGETMRGAFDETLQDYQTFKLREFQLELSDSKVQYALLPVWLLNTRWEGKLYRFAMNGQTGKMIGDLPEDPKKVQKSRLKNGLIYALLGMGVAYILAYFFF